MAAAAVEALTKAFPGRITTPDAGSAFEAASKAPWSQTCWEPARAFVALHTAQEVSEALAIVRKAGSPFAIRCSGHNPNPGFSSAGDDGVVLDIRQLQTRELSEDGIARCGAGNLWGEIYQWLEEDHKLTAIGGRDRQVGLSGFLLGGGLGAFPNLHGLGADGVKNFEVVLADGRIVNANAEENANLWRALKGGGSNFGVVTRFDLQTYPLLKVQYTIRMYNGEDHDNIHRATLQVQDAMDRDPKIGLFTNFHAGIAVVGLLYADHTETLPEAFKPFDDLSSLMTTFCPLTKGTLLSLAVAMGHVVEAKKRHIGTITTKVSADLYEAVFDSWKSNLGGLPEGTDLHYTIQPLGSACVQAGQSRGENIMGLDNVAQCWWVFTCEWPEGGDDTAAKTGLDACIAGVRQAAEERGMLLDYLCMTFATGSQKVLASYGANNEQRLREAATAHDPEGVFQRLQNNGFLLTNSL